MSVCSVQRHENYGEYGCWRCYCCFPACRPRPPTAIGYGVVENSSYVNLRSQPTQSSTRLGYYQPGVWVEITGESDNWYSVNGPDGKSGWMSKNFIRVEPDVVQAVGIVTNPLERGYLNLRQTPSYSGRVLDYYYNGVAPARCRA